VDLIRAWADSDLGETACVICKIPFMAESVLATTWWTIQSTTSCPWLSRRW